jgi:AcrR family transcriptional regulator
VPRPRFNKLPVEKREQILEAAAKEFVANGYENASLNRILEQAGISKGAGYYYFDDKADVFVTTVDYYTQRTMSEINIEFEKLTAETFWPTLMDMYRPMFAKLSDEPWMLTAWKVSAKLSKEARTNPMLAKTFDRARGLLFSFLKRGQQIGAVRSDLPDDLLLAFFQSIDSASDQWMIDHWEELDSERMQEITLQVVDAIRRLMMP